MGELPPIRDSFLPNTLVKAGPVVSGFNGAEPISPERLLAWSHGAGFPLWHWAFECILEASEEYAAMLKDDKAPMPYVNGVDREKASASIKSVMRQARGKAHG